MKILVLSDSHSALSFMRRCVKKIKPDAIIHLGDHFEDGQVLAEENPHIVVHQVPGNCDIYRCPIGVTQTLTYPIDGVPMYITHGHLHGVKSGTGQLLADARRNKSQIVLYGHTHRAECRREPDGLWVMNPGSCGSYGGSAGLVVTEGNQVQGCWLLYPEDL